MTTTVRATAPTRVPMEFARKAALVAGIFYLVTFVSSIPAALVLLPPVLDNPDYIVSAGADTRVIWGCVLDVVNALAGIGTAVALFSVLKRQHEGFALGLVTTRIFEGAVIMIGVSSILSVVTLQEPGTAAGADAAAMVAVGQAQIATFNWSFLLGQSLMPALNAVLLGTLLYRSRLVPRVLPIVGLIGAPLLLAGTLATLFGLAEQYGVVSVTAVPIALWELSLGLWLTFKGFNRSAPIMVAAAAEAASPHDSTRAVPRVPVAAPGGVA
jgi:Domain of unknown function (DUF4386)